MGLVAVVAIVAVLAIRPRSVARLAATPLRLGWVLPVALGLQVLVVDVAPGWPHLVGATLHVASYLLLAVVLVVNLRLPGLPLVATGSAANAVTIAVNGGVLPASASALQAAGWNPADPGFSNSAALASPRLAFLGDVYVTPGWVPFANVFSIGDVIIALGIVAAVIGLTRRRPRHRATGRLLTPRAAPLRRSA